MHAINTFFCQVINILYECVFGIFLESVLRIAFILELYFGLFCGFFALLILKQGHGLNWLFWDTLVRGREIAKA